MEIDPNDGDAHYNLGNTLLQMGRAKEAVSHYEAALQINPDDRKRSITHPGCWPPRGMHSLVMARERCSWQNKPTALTQGGSPMINATLAAAYAEAGRFEMR